MDCRHSTGDDQRLRTQYRSRDCGHSTGNDRDCGHRTEDHRLRTFGGRGSSDLNLTGTRSHFRGVVLPSSSRGGFCDSRVPTAHAREALRFVNGPEPSG
ncbi:unnamed protein product, partial [Staurois parvus]